MVPASTVSGGFPSKEAARLGSPSNSILSIFQRTGHARDADGREHLRQGERGPRALRSARPQPTLALTAACTHFQLTRHQNRTRALSPALPASWLCSATLQPSSHLHRDGTGDRESEVVMMGREHGNDAGSRYRLTHRRVASKISSCGADQIRRHTYTVASHVFMFSVTLRISSFGYDTAIFSSSFLCFFIFPRLTSPLAVHSTPSMASMAKGARTEWRASKLRPEQSASHRASSVPPPSSSPMPVQGRTVGIAVQKEINAQQTCLDGQEVLGVLIVRVVRVGLDKLGHVV